MHVAICHFSSMSIMCIRVPDLSCFLSNSTQYTHVELVLLPDPEIGLGMSEIHNFMRCYASHMVTLVSWPYQYIIAGPGTAGGKHYSSSGKA